MLRRQRNPGQRENQVELIGWCSRGSISARKVFLHFTVSRSQFVQKNQVFGIFFTLHDQKLQNSKINEGRKRSRARKRELLEREFVYFLLQIGRRQNSFEPFHIFLTILEPKILLEVDNSLNPSPVRL